MLTLCKSSNIGEKTMKKSNLVFWFNPWYFGGQGLTLNLPTLETYVLFCFIVITCMLMPIGSDMSSSSSQNIIQNPTSHWMWIKAGGLLNFTANCTSSFAKSTSTRRHCLFQTIRGGLLRGNPHVRCAHLSHRLVRTSSLWIQTCETSIKRLSYTWTLNRASTAGWSNL